MYSPKTLISTGGNNLKKQWQGILLYVAIFFVIIAVMAFSGTGTTSSTDSVQYTYSELVEDLSGTDIETINIQRETDVDNYATAKVTFRDGKVAEVVIPSVSTLMDTLNETGADRLSKS